MTRADWRAKEAGGSEVDWSSPEADLGGGNDRSKFSSVLQGLRSENQDLTAGSARTPTSASDARRRTSTDPSVNTHVDEPALRYLAHRGAPNWEESASRSGAESRRAEQPRSSRGASSSHGQSISDLEAAPKRRRLDYVAPQGRQAAISEQQCNAALDAIYFARDIAQFSRAVVENDKRLQRVDKKIHAAFMQKAAAQFRSQFVTHFEDDIRRRESFGHATACNAVTREAGGQEGLEACKAVASRVSQLSNTLMRELKPAALALFATSFGRQQQSKTCRNGVIRIAEFCRDEPKVLAGANSQNLSLLVNGFSKWTQEAGTREGTEAIARVVRRAGRNSELSDFEQKHLAMLVNGFSKWPDAPDCRDGTFAIASEVLRRREFTLSGFEPQTLANLVSGFSKWPDEADPREATLAIASEVLRRDRRARLSEFNHQNLANLVNGFSKWPDARDCRDATLAIAGEVLRRDELFHFKPQELANLVNGFIKWSDARDSFDATFAIAGEVLRRGARHFESQHLAMLVNGFSKWPDARDCRDATLAIAGEVLRRDRYASLSKLTHQQVANLVNGFSKWPDEADTRDATFAIAGEVLRRDRHVRLSEFTYQELANLVNGLSKWADAPDCRGATVAIAGEVLRRSARLSQFIPQELGNLVNGFGKWPDAPECREATFAIAGELLRRAELAHFSHQHLANLVNGFSKWPDARDCREATSAIAHEVLRRGTQLSHFTPQELANLVNGFSKWPDAPDCGDATVAIAGEVVHRGARGEFALSGFNRRDFAHLVNGFSKWPNAPACRGATFAIAGEILRRGARHFSDQHLAMLVNGFSKWPDAPDCPEATFAIAREVLRAELFDFAPQALANLVNGFSKWPDAPDCRGATCAIAHEVLRRAELSDFTPQGLTNLVNGFSKWPEAPDCRKAAFAIAGEVLRRGARDEFALSDFNRQDFANLVNGFSKWPESEDCLKATMAIAQETRQHQLSNFPPQAVANLLNGFSKWPEEPICCQSTMDIARELGAGAQRFSVFTTPQLAMLANALSRTIMRAEESGEITDAALPKDRLHKLAHYLHYDNDRLLKAEVLSITNIFKAPGKAGLFDDLGLLAPTGLSRLSELRSAPGFSAENNLETMGNLSAALLPLARSLEKPLRWHRRQALNVLNDLQPVLEQKIKAHLNAGDAERSRGPLASRSPALSIYQTLKARAALERLFRSPYVEGNGANLRARQKELQRGTREILASARDLIQGDLSSMSWNLIAQIEADSPVDALDLFMEQDAAAIQAQHPPSAFDVHQVLRAMDHAPRSPQGEAGLMQLPVVDMHGGPLAMEPETRYSIFHRLTSGVLPVVAVQLPAPPSAFMLARTVNVNGIPYRMDLFGGSRLKPPRLTVSQVATRTRDEQAKPSGGKLLAIPYAETAPGTAFEQLSRAWAPFKEAYYYNQRRGFAAPPAIKGLSPHDSALEGAFKLALLPDRPANVGHPFQLRGPDGPIALRPHDGCGFIRGSLAKLMPAVRRAGEQEGPDRVHAFAEGTRASLPAMALQHYPRSEQVADEARQKAMSWLESRVKQELTSEELFRVVTAANINGPGAIAIPSGDGCLHVPRLKSETLTGGGVLIGRSPYDQPNLRPFALDRVRSAADGDPTAAFLDQCVTIQYSFNVAHKSGEELAVDDPTFFAKGLLIVVPDEMWPADFADRGLVMSAEDVKCHSSWIKGKDRVTADSALDCIGILQATEIFAPGSLVAIPPDEQKKLDGDFDGDTAIIIADRPQLYEHVRQFDQEEQARGLRSLKPPKSHTPAIEDGRYNFGRASQILAATRNVLETYTGLQRGFLAQSHEARQWFAERAIFGTYEGIDRELKRDIRALLEQEQVSAHDVRDKLEKARHDIELAHHPIARETAELLLTELEAWAAGLDQQVPPELLPETAATANERQLAMSQELCELFPPLAETYPATAHPRDRVQLLVDRYPTRIDPRPDGYMPHDLVQSAKNLLSIGIKVGTDAYKSDTGAYAFMIKSRQLQRLLQQTPGLKSAPYTKSLAATLNQGRFDVDAALEDLKDNPTLAASIMQASIKLAAERGILREPSDLTLATEDVATTITLTREEAAQRAQMEVSRAQAEEKDITRTAKAVAEALKVAGIEVKMPHLAKRLRSPSSMTDELTGLQASSETGVQLFNNAVRHVFEFSDRDFTRAFKKAILAFEESGYSEVSTTNWFRTRSRTFAGIKTVFGTPGGYRFELEFHTADSYKAKLDNHETYKELQKLRRLQRGSEEPPDESIAEQLLERVRGACNRVVIPEGAAEIPHWEAEAGNRVGARPARVSNVTRPTRAARSARATEIVGALDNRPIVLVGMMGAGKSTVGPALAKQLGLTFVDSDKEIEAKTGKSITRIFAEDGEAHFRDLEANEICRLLDRGPLVLATGGGAFMSEEVRRRVGEKAVSIWLNTNEDVIRRNLRHDTNRPKIQTADRDEMITKLMEQRNPVYKLANLTIAPQDRRELKSADACLSELHGYLCAGGGLDAGQSGSVMEEMP
ncbi:shikimate kinase [Bradyrhizobium sp. 33ap4]|uniref:shikimate kinase n=1 Tax=Bradyrhizobium sp. 33ap4 TaxID=3061630 RepID=UPI00292CF81C|nr:shikimate kinase [Bradyrhizobium sp. 33ap4]